MPTTQPMYQSYDMSDYNKSCNKDDGASSKSDNVITMRKQRAAILGKMRYKNLSGEQKQVERDRRKENARRWRKKEKEEKQQMKMKVLETSILQERIKVERNRTVLYSLPGSGCHKGSCNIHLSKMRSDDGEPTNRRTKLIPSLSSIIPLKDMATLDVAIASHLLPPIQKSIYYHPHSIVSVKVLVGEAILFYDNLVHRGGESESPNIRSFATFGEKGKELLLEKRNYITNVKECPWIGCVTCEKLQRLKRDRDGYIINMTRTPEPTIGESVHSSVNLEEYGFVVIKICDMTDYQDGVKVEAERITRVKDGAIRGTTFVSIDQEEENMERYGKKRMILKDHGITTSSTFISTVFPNVSEFIKSASSVLSEHLNRHYGVTYVLHDYTLLRNGEKGTGKQRMHRDDKGVCNCSFH